MAFGYWGGKAPIINLLVSKLVFLAIRWRLFSLQIKNRLRTAPAIESEAQHHPQEVNAKLQNYLNAGLNKFNIGGGGKNLSGFINIDFIPHPQVNHEIVANILNLGFIPSGCAAQIHSNHVIEHLTEDDLLQQLKEYGRILSSEGILSIRCPNALGVAYGFWFDPILEQNREEFVRCGFPQDEDFNNPADKWCHKDVYAFTHWVYGDVGNIANQHLNAITPTKISNYLKASGFNIVRMSEPEALNLVVIASKSENPN